MKPKHIEVKITNIAESLIKKHRNKDPEYKTIFDGPNFPHESELDQLLILCEVVKENFICMDPLDQVKKKNFQPKFKICAEVLNEII